MDDAAQGRPVAGAVEVVADCAWDRVGRQTVPQALEDPTEFFGGKQIEQHEDIGLLRKLVPVRRVTFGLQDEVQAADVGMPGAIVLPVELFQRFIAFELADDAVGQPRHPQSAADPVPAPRLSIGQAQTGPEVAAVVPGQQGHDILRSGQDPGGKHVGIRIIAKPLTGRAGITVVKLVRSHHAGDVETIIAGVMDRDAAE
ncbi:hypothetical protein GCM10011333_34200 [Sediminivirga luteola]|uniref:Uncharacterized protein n=1 Tax=Sediminivirga luteola TaxID=1774748 RepID=A0A8J2XMQ1_9MICO|nr:hypothetical protein GCM10011333_34200 [Sediminivirga luteola]